MNVLNAYNRLRGNYMQVHDNLRAEWKKSSDGSIIFTCTFLSLEMCRERCSLNKETASLPFSCVAGVVSAIILSQILPLIFEFLCNSSPEDRLKAFEYIQTSFYWESEAFILEQTIKQLRLATSQTVADRKGNAFIVKTCCRYWSIFD